VCEPQTEIILLGRLSGRIERALHIRTTDWTHRLFLGQRYASTAFTLDTYAHVLPHMQDEAAATMEAMLFLATVSRIVTIRGSAPDTIKAIAIDVIGCRNLITKQVVSRTRLFHFPNCRPSG